MKLLYLSRWLPYPPDNGSKLRIYHLLTRLAGLGHQIELITFYEANENPQPAIEHLRQFCSSVEAVAYKPFRPSSWKARAAFLSPRPRSVIATFQPAMAQKVEYTLASGEVEMLVASQIDLAAYGLKAKAYGIPAVLDELEVGVLYEQFKLAQTTRAKFRSGLTWLKLAYYLRRLAHHYRAITVVSEREKVLAQRLINRDKLHLLPNGANLADYNFKPYQADERQHRLIFNGSLGFSLNFEAMQFFLQQVFPLVRKTEPELGLLITGRYEGIDLLNLTNTKQQAELQGVEFSGFVPDLSPLVAGSKICIAPLLRGGGTRLKILEAFALGTPVVATSKGVEGLEAQPNRHLLVADSPQEFNQAIQRLLNEPGLAQSLTANAYQLVKTKYDWNIIADQFDQLLHKSL